MSELVAHTHFDRAGVESGNDVAEAAPGSQDEVGLGVSVEQVVDIHHAGETPPSGKGENLLQAKIHDGHVVRAVVCDVFQKDGLGARAGDLDAVNGCPGPSTLMADVGGNGQAPGEHVASEELSLPVGVVLAVGNVQARLWFCEKKFPELIVEEGSATNTLRTSPDAPLSSSRHW